MSVPTIAHRIYRLTGQSDFRSSLQFIKDRPLLARVFTRDLHEDINEWIDIYDTQMTDVQKFRAQKMLDHVKHEIEREHAEAYYY